MHTMSSFLSTWAMAYRGSIHKVIHSCFDLSSILPPRDLPKVEPPVGLMPVSECEEHLGEMVKNSRGQFQEELRKGDTNVLAFTSWCRFPLHRVDLGWGEPEFVSSLCSPFDSVSLMDHKKGDDDGGIVARVSLTEDNMDLFYEKIFRGFDEFLCRNKTPTHARLGVRRLRLITVKPSSTGDTFCDLSSKSVCTPCTSEHQNFNSSTRRVCQQSVSAHDIGKPLRASKSGCRYPSKFERP
ncbi:hypothetical protein NL676_039185 [Syzygium grande]|nr:hypothetical protein NL676_039185 [Syzygium grande]